MTSIRCPPSRWPVVLGGTEFWSPEELYHGFGLLLSSTPTHKPLRGKARASVLELLSFHPVRSAITRRAQM